jgi:hypothetical protein
VKDIVTDLRDFGLFRESEVHDIGRMKTLEEAERIMIQVSGSVFGLRGSCEPL